VIVIKSIVFVPLGDAGYVDPPEKTALVPLFTGGGGNQTSPALVPVPANGSLKLDIGLLSERKGAISILFEYLG
tara:strand:- start:111 stop:332 length:222 start_codon:yes stop_codon:yes gene_type:complete